MLRQEDAAGSFAKDRETSKFFLEPSTQQTLSPPRSRGALDCRLLP